MCKIATRSAKNEGLGFNADGSLTINMRKTSPGDDKLADWLPARIDEAFSLYVRTHLAAGAGARRQLRAATDQA
jgi:hypothetical protein